MKQLAKDYGIQIVDWSGNDLPYIEDLNRSYMVFIKDPRLALTIPDEFIKVDHKVWGMPIPPIDEETLVLSSINDIIEKEGITNAVILRLTYDNEYENLYWRDITVDMTIIKKIFGCQYK